VYPAGFKRDIRGACYSRQILCVMAGAAVPCYYAIRMSETHLHACRDWLKLSIDRNHGSWTASTWKPALRPDLRLSRLPAI